MLSEQYGGTGLLQRQSTICTTNECFNPASSMPRLRMGFAGRLEIAIIHLRQSSRFGKGTYWQGSNKAQREDGDSKMRLQVKACFP